MRHQAKPPAADQVPRPAEAGASTGLALPKTHVSSPSDSPIKSHASPNTDKQAFLPAVSQLVSPAFALPGSEPPPVPPHQGGNRPYANLQRPQTFFLHHSRSSKNRQKLRYFQPSGCSQLSPSFLILPVTFTNVGIAAHRTHTGITPRHHHLAPHLLIVLLRSPTPTSTIAKMRSKFKDEHPFEKRKAEAERIRQKYSDRIPVSISLAPSRPRCERLIETGPGASAISNSC